MRLRDFLLIIAVVAHAMSILHNLGVSHGDLHPGQVMVQTTGGDFQVSLTDFDNYSQAGAPAAFMAGRLEYMGPKTRGAYLDRRSPQGSIQEDLVSLAIMAQVAFLLRHPGPADTKPNSPEFHDAMMARHWLDDTDRPDRSSLNGGTGLPVRALSRRIIHLFRRAWANPDDPPRAPEWRRASIEAAFRVAPCLRCGGLSVGDEHRTRGCPYCGQRFPALRMVGSAGVDIPLTGVRQALGRSELGGHLSISEEHCVVTCRPPITSVECIGRFGTELLQAGSWEPLATGVAVPLAPGDRLRFAGCHEAEVIVES